MASPTKTHTALTIFWIFLFSSLFTFTNKIKNLDQRKIKISLFQIKIFISGKTQTKFSSFCINQKLLPFSTTFGMIMASSFFQYTLCVMLFNFNFTFNLPVLLCMNMYVCVYMYVCLSDFPIATLIFSIWRKKSDIIVLFEEPTVWACSGCK